MEQMFTWGGTPETSPNFEKLILSFIDISKKTEISDEEKLEFEKNKKELFETIIYHRTQDDNYEMYKMNLEMDLEKLKFKKEFSDKKETESYPLIKNVVSGFDD